MFPKRYRKMIMTGFGETFRPHVKIVETPWQDPGPGEVVVRNIFAGVNGVYDLNMVRNAIGYISLTAPADLGIETVGSIVALGPGVTGFKEGDAVATWKVGRGYRDYQVAPISRLYRIREPSREILTLIPTGVSGMVGLERVGELKPGETVAVSAAAGGLGHIVVQVAKKAGAHVIGITSGDDKVALLRSLGCDRVINHRKEDLGAALAAEYPRGLDVAYDSVGGRIFDTFVDHLAVRGRLVISGYTSEVGRKPEVVTAPRPWTKLYFKSASIRGFINPHYQEFWPDAAERLLSMYYAGELKVLVDPTPFKGLESVCDAVEYLLAGKNAGKVVVDLSG